MIAVTLALAVFAAAADSTPPAMPVSPMVGGAASATARAAVTPGDTLDLEVLEREALTRNPSLAARRAAAAEARAHARVAGALEDPMVEFATAPRSWFESPADDAHAAPNDDLFPAYRIGIRQKLPIFGERGLERASARAEAAAVTLDAEAARLDVLHEVRHKFYELYRIARALENNDEQVALMQQFRRVALTRYAAGTEGQQDPLMADAELGMLAHERAVLERERRSYSAILNTLLHRSAAAPLGPSPRRIVLPLPPAPADSAAWPELLARDARVEAGEARAALAGRRRLPVLELGVEQDFFEGERERRTVASVAFNLPIHLPRLGAERAEARAALERLRREREASADDLGLRLERARADYEEMLHELEVLETAVLPTRERALTGARAAYEAGRGGFLVLLETARARARARLELETARSGAAHAWAALRRALATDVTILSPAKEPLR